MTGEDRLGLEDLEPGDIGFGPIGGLVGLFVGVGQVVLGDESRFRHAFVVTEPGGVDGGAVRVPQVVEAMPSGARKVGADGRWNRRYVYVRLEGYPPQVRAEIARHAEAMVGTPYGFSDYLALGLKRLGVRLGWLDRWISRVDGRGYPVRAICSQLVDAACTRAGVSVFDDGRLSQDVIPGALFYQLLRIGGRAYWPR